MSDKKASDGDGAGSVDPWTYQCGKCGADFKTAAERDQHMIGCGNTPTTTKSSRRDSAEERWLYRLNMYDR